MSEQEEPVAKLAKLENSVEEMDEGQEEWLSEGILTDDDLNPAADNDSSAVQSQDEATEQVGEPKDEEGESKGDGAQVKTDKIEEALDNMEKTDKNEDDLSGDLGTFLVRKSDGTIIETRTDSDLESPRHTDEDANDTDELLRMLGDDDQKAKKKKEGRKIVEKNTKDDQSTDEEVYTSKVTRLKSKLTKKVPPKAVPEAMSGEEIVKVKSRLKIPKKPILKNVQTKTKSAGESDEKLSNKTKRASIAEPEELTDDGNVSSDDKDVMKKMFSIKKKVHFAAKSTGKPSASAKLQTPAIHAQRERDISESMKRLEALKKAQKPKEDPMDESEEVINNEEFLEEDAFDMDEYRNELETEIRGEAQNKQRLMRPEQMDEEFLSDGDSGSDDNSYYDELPSSESEEDMEDWFKFDIRTERAGDYLPLLGDRAHQVLSEERSRLTARVASLRFDLAAATAAAHAHAAQLRRAATAVAELDAAIKAA